MNFQDFIIVERDKPVLERIFSNSGQSGQKVECIFFQKLHVQKHLINCVWKFILLDISWKFIQYISMILHQCIRPLKLLL